MKSQISVKIFVIYSNRNYQLYHNYFRPHMALDEKTPAEMCGVEIQGDNKWITVIQDASKRNG